MLFVMGRPLGQHFLADQQILIRIVQTIAGMLDEHAIATLREIGPGQGALTQHIYMLVDTFLCFEKDTGMEKHLMQFLQQEHVVWGDVLEDDVAKRSIVGNKKIVVGNLPYYITSPILRKFFDVGQMGEDNKDMIGGVFLIQKEVAEKMMTTARKKSYLWRLLNYSYDIEYLFTVPPEAFSPPPKVDSAVIRLVRKQDDLMPTVAYTRLVGFLDIVSPFKRKTLGKIAKMRSEELSQIGVVIPELLEGKRLEEMSWDDVKICMLPV